jgi:hypothetical protein
VLGGVRRCGMSRSSHYEDTELERQKRVPSLAAFGGGFLAVAARGACCMATVAATDMLHPTAYAATRRINLKKKPDVRRAFWNPYPFFVYQRPDPKLNPMLGPPE